MYFFSISFPILNEPQTPKTKSVRVGVGFTANETLYILHQASLQSGSMLHVSE